MSTGNSQATASCLSAVRTRGGIHDSRTAYTIVMKATRHYAYLTRTNLNDLSGCFYSDVDFNQMLSLASQRWMWIGVPAHPSVVTCFVFVDLIRVFGHG